MSVVHLITETLTAALAPAVTPALASAGAPAVTPGGGVVAMPMPGLGELLRQNPLPPLLAFTALAGGGLLVARALRPLLRRTRSLSLIVTVVALASLAFAFAAAAVAAAFMVLDHQQLASFAAVLGVAAGFAVLLAVAMVQPLVADVERLGAVAERVERGDLTVRSGIDRRDELGQAARAIDAMLSRLDELERQRDGMEAERRALLSNIGHDLRSPLAALQAAVEALVDGVAPDPPRYLRSMEHDLAALNALVEDVFLLGRLEAGRFGVTATPFDLRATIDEAVESLVPFAATKGVELVVRGPLLAASVGSPEAVARVVRNLTDNAVRHAPTDSAVTIGLAPAASTAQPPTTPGREPGDGAQGAWFVEVSDLGAGFPAAFRAHAFEVSTRADDARRRSDGGAGLGLAIARGLVAAHGGEIWIPEGSGGRVCFSLPSRADGLAQGERSGVDEPATSSRPSAPVGAGPAGPAGPAGTGPVALVPFEVEAATGGGTADAERGS